MSPHPFRRAALALALTCSAPLVPAGARAEVQTPIQPGAKIFSPIGQCTMNFVFEDAEGALYIGTAGHCAGVGHRVSSERGEFGTTVYSVRTTVKDFALIRIDESSYDDVSPTLRYWGGPTGVTTATETTAGEPLLQYGYGIGFSEHEPTRRRTGPLSADSFTRYRGYVPSSFGDSGSPVIHGLTGEALGVVVELSYGTGLSNGPTIEGILADLRAEGIEVQVRTAPFVFPPAP